MDGNFVGQNSNGPEAVASIRKVSDVYIVMTSSEEDLAHQGLLNGANNVMAKDEIVKDANILLPLLQELILKK
jgi:pentose-5-phosphate-3-epimerase